MAEKEKIIMQRVLREMDANRDRLFRINAGMGWTGRTIEHTPSMLALANPRPLHAAPEGWPDLFGWTTVEITPDMVGKKVAVVRAVEIKAGRDKMRSEQTRFKDLIESMGGIYEIASE